MKKTLKSAGAVGLAAATILTGLSFGPAAASAAPVEIASQPSIVAGLALTNGATTFNVLGPAATGIQAVTRNVSPRRYEVGAVGQVSVIRDATSDRCMSRDYPPNQLQWLRLLPCTGDADQQWVITEDGRVQAPGDVPTAGMAVNPLGESDGRLVHVKNTPYALRLTDPEPIRGSLTATVASTNVAGRSAVVTGTGVAGATVIVGDEEVEVAADNTWTLTITGLALGSNPFIVSQWENNVMTDKFDLDVPIVVSPVTAETTFSGTVTDNATLSGTAHPGATVVVRDAGGAEIDRTPASTDADGAWSMEIPAPNAGGDYGVKIHQEIDGEANGEIDHTVAYGAGVSITTPVDDMAHTGGPVAMRGTGEPNAEIKVREKGHTTVLGTANVLANSNWSLSTVNLDDREHVLEVTQTGKGNNVTTSTITINPGAEAVAPMTVETPENGSTVTTSRPTFTGHGQDGATVTIGYGANSIIGTAVVENGEWTIAPTRGLGMGVSDLIVTQTMGDDVQTVHHTLTRVAVELPLAVTSHVDGQAYAQGMTTFRGTAPVGSVVRATNQWGTPMGTATATDGTWSFNRNLGPTSAGYDLTFTATPPVGDPQTVSLKLNFAGVLGFEVTSPVNDSTYAVGTTTFTGTAMPGTVVTATNQWSTPMGRATAGLAGTWAFDRYLGPTSAGYDIAFVATKGTDTQRTALHLNTAVVNQPVAVTSHTEGATYRPGMNVLTGTGTPGATVEAVNATNGWNVRMGRATVAADGTWALPERNWGPSNDYAVQVTQTNPDKTTSTTTVNVKAPVFAPLVLTSPQVGDTYDTGVAARFEGTATPFAEITVRSAKSSAVYRTVEADVNGSWSFDRVWGPTHDYVLTIDQKAKNGQSDSITGFAWNHSGN